MVVITKDRDSFWYTESVNGAIWPISQVVSAFESSQTVNVDSDFSASRFVPIYEDSSTDIISISLNEAQIIEIKGGALDGTQHNFHQIVEEISRLSKITWKTEDWASIYQPLSGVSTSIIKIAEEISRLSKITWKTEDWASIYQPLSGVSTNYINFLYITRPIAQEIFNDSVLKTLDEIKLRIQNALADNNISLARKLAIDAHETFPDDEYLKEAAYTLSPPKLLHNDVLSKPGLKASRKWIREHSDVYRGKWIAVRQGQFVEAGISRQDLIEKLGNEAKADDVIISFIP